MNKPIKVLIVEDSEDDAKLALRALHRGGFDPTHRRVQTAADLGAALAQERWDAVISDFSMPGFTGMDALGMFRSAGLDIPFILISGTIGEATAVAAMKAGASDYMMKSSLARLAPALERELKETHMRAANQRAQAALIDSEERFRQMAENIRDVFFLVDVDGERVLYVSPAYEEIWGRSSKSLYANPQSWTEAVHPDDQASAYEKYGQIVSASNVEFEFRMVRADGSIRWIKARGFPVRDDADKIVRIAGIATDVTDQKTDAEKIKTAQDRITHLNRVYAVLSGINTLIVRVRDRDELFKETCRIAVEEGGFRMAMVAIVRHNTTKIVPVATAGKDEELVTAISNILSSSEDAPKTMSARAIRDKKAVVSNAAQNDPQVLFSAQYVKAGVHSMAVLPLIVSDEAVGVLALYASETEFFKEEELKLLSELAGDVAFGIDHIEKQERLNYLAYYDVLTGLANRSLFLERVAQSMRSAASGGNKLALFLIDLERFKNINDSLGRPAGDALLRQVGEWLTSKVGDANLLARVGADLFAVVLPEVKQDGEVARALEKLMAAFLEHPFQLNDAVFRITAKVGIALFPYDGTDTDTLFKNAEAALNKAKASGERYLFYTQKMTEMVAGKLTLENQLRQALDKGEFVLHYQPKVSLVSGKMTSAEALIRWNDPRTGLVPPARFIPILEETGLIYEVGRWALRQAINDALRWRSAGLAAVRIAVNVSPLQLRHRSFIDEVKQAISIDAQAAAGLELEITESLLMEDVQRSITSLQAIRDMGVSLAIDDFGTGFSSLSYLSKFPVDTLKIDRSFVIEMTDAPESLALVSTIISLAHALKLKVVAEGVETEEQSRLLRVLNCDEIQGFLFSKPVPSDIFEAKYLALPSPQ